MIVLVTGASGSGKSEYAENLVMEASFSNRYYIATMAVYGDEGRDKVLRHKRQRQGKGFVTLERQKDLGGLDLEETAGAGEAGAGETGVDTGVADAGKTNGKKMNSQCQEQLLGRRDCTQAAVLLECVSNLAANEMFGQEDTAAAEPGMQRTPEMQRTPAMQREPEVQRTPGMQWEPEVQQMPGIQGEPEVQQPAMQWEPEVQQMPGMPAGTEILAEKIVSDIGHVARRTSLMVIVTNEVGEDGIQYEPETMEYIRLMGLVNQKLARMADRVVEVVYGIPVEWKS